MNTGGEAAERLVRDSLMITEEAVKLAGLGAKNLAAILVALAKEEGKTHGPTRLTRLLRSGEELKLLPIKARTCGSSAGLQRNTASCSARSKTNLWTTG